MKNIDKIKVNTRADFSKFMEQLLEDYSFNSANWENKTLADFLEALARYSEDIQGYYDNTQQSIDADQPTWRTFADMFLGARMYE